jgi:hypothetical protein
MEVASQGMETPPQTLGELWIAIRSAAAVPSPFRVIMVDNLLLDAYRLGLEVPMTGDPMGRNLAKAMLDGPRLRWDYDTWVEARDPARGLVLVGGLGCWGLGSMWCSEQGLETYLGFREAPIVDSSEHQDGIANGPPLGATKATPPHDFERMGWRWWLCRHCFGPKSLHPRTVWVNARPVSDRTYLSPDAPHFGEGW